MSYSNNEYKTQKVGLSPYEAAKQERRVARALKQGTNMTRLLQMGLTEARIRQIAAANNIAIVKGGGRKW